MFGLVGVRTVWFQGGVDGVVIGGDGDVVIKAEGL